MKFSAAKKRASASAAGDQDLAVREQDCRVEVASIVKAACELPIVQCFVVPFCARDDARAVGATCDQDRAICKQCCGVQFAAIMEPVGIGPRTDGWIVEFRAGVFIPRVLEATCDKHLAVRQ